MWTTNLRLLLRRGHSRNQGLVIHTAFLPDPLSPLPQGWKVTPRFSPLSFQRSWERGRGGGRASGNPTSLAETLASLVLPLCWGARPPGKPGHVRGEHHRQPARGAGVSVVSYGILPERREKRGASLLQEVSCDGWDSETGNCFQGCLLKVLHALLCLLWERSPGGPQSPDLDLALAPCPPPGPQTLWSPRRVCLEGVCGWGEKREQQRACPLHNKQTSRPRGGERQQYAEGGGAGGGPWGAGWHKGMLFRKARAGHPEMDRWPFIPQPGFGLKPFL